MKKFQNIEEDSEKDVWSQICRPGGKLFWIVAVIIFLELSFYRGTPILNALILSLLVAAGLNFFLKMFVDICRYIDDLINGRGKKW